MRGHPDFEFLVRRQQRLSESARDGDFSASGSTRVLLAESSRMVAEALMLAIDVEPSLEPIGYALEGWEALELTETLHPDVIVVGAHLTGLDGLTLTRLLSELWPRVGVVVLTETNALDRVAPAHAADTADYLPLDCSADELMEAIAAASGRPPRLHVAGSYPLAEASNV